MNNLRVKKAELNVVFKLFISIFKYLYYVKQLLKKYERDSMKEEGTRGGKDTLKMTGCQGCKVSIILSRSMAKVLYYPTGI